MYPISSLVRESLAFLYMLYISVCSKRFIRVASCNRCFCNIPKKVKESGSANPNTTDVVHVTQVYPNRSRYYVFSEELKGTVVSLDPVVDAKYVYHHYLDALSYFLPKGYPTSVRDNYATYAGCQSMAYVFSSACSVLSMQAMLSAIGVGAGAIPLAATLNWILKDGIGQFGGVVFAAAVNNQFDSDPKRWRMLSTVSMDLSSFVELLTPLYPAYFLPLASLANVGKNISFLSASASRAAIHKSFAIHENLADITAKSGSQTVLASLVGTSLGAGGGVGGGGV